MKRYCAIAILLLACGDKGLYSGHPLVGTWNYQRSNFTELGARNLRAHLAAQGLSEDQISQVILDFTSENQGVSLGVTQLTFVEDGSFTDNVGGSGTWTAQESSLTMRESSGFVLEANFDIDEGVLSIGLDKNQFLSFMRQGGGTELDAGDQTFIDIIFGNTGQVQFYFTM